MVTRSEMKRFRLAIFYLLCCVIGVSAHAELYDLTRITNNSTDLVFEPGAFTIDVLPENGNVLMIVSNNYSLDSVVTQICFLENDLIEFVDFAPSPVSTEGLAFSVMTQNANLPAGHPYGFTPQNTFGVDADPAGPKNGLHPGQSLGLYFDLTNGTTYGELIGAMNQLKLRAGIHVQALPGDFSESFISTVPEPATLGLMGIGFLLIAQKKRGTAQ